MPKTLHANCCSAQTIGFQLPDFAESLSLSICQDPPTSAADLRATVKRSASVSLRVQQQREDAQILLPIRKK